MIIKMVNEFKLTVVHFARPNPMQTCACAWIYRWTKNCGKSGHRASRPPGSPTAGPRDRGAVAGRGLRAAGRWATGLVLAKPYQNGVSSPHKALQR